MRCMWSQHCLFTVTPLCWVCSVLLQCHWSAVKQVCIDTCLMRDLGQLWEHRFRLSLLASEVDGSQNSSSILTCSTCYAQLVIASVILFLQETDAAPAIALGHEFCLQPSLHATARQTFHSFT